MTKDNRLRVAIVGNSNSILVESFSRHLASDPGLIINNQSIGATTNVVLLDFASRETDWDYDFIIIETAVVDSLQAYDYPVERSSETLELFIRYVRSVSKGCIVMVTIPTKNTLLFPANHYQDDLYRGTASRFGIPILDGFELIRSLVGRPKMASVAFWTQRADHLVSAFGLPRHFIEILAWRALRDSSLPSNALGIFGYFDGAHFNASLHRLIADLLIAFMRATGPAIAETERVSTPVVRSVYPAGGTPILRENSFIARPLTRMSLGESTCYTVPADYLAYGILANEAQTACILHLDSPAGSAVFDMRFLPIAMPFMATITQIRDPVGEGDVTVTILDPGQTDGTFRIRPRTGSAFRNDEAELAELIIVHKDWRTLLPSGLPDVAGSFNIIDAPYGVSLIAEATKHAAVVIAGCERGGTMVDQSSVTEIGTIIASLAGSIKLTDRARVLLLLGLHQPLFDFLDSCAEGSDEGAELALMREAVHPLRENDLQPTSVLLQQAATLVGLGEIAAAEAAYSEGMARFPGEAAFFFDYAWIASNAGDWPEAIRRWRLALACVPDHPIAWVHLALTLRSAGHPDEAEPILEKGMRKFPQEAEMATVYAHLALDRDDMPLSRQRVQDLITRHPGHRNGRLMHIDLLLRRQALPEAQRAIEALLAEQGGCSHLIAMAEKALGGPDDIAWLRRIGPSLINTAPDKEAAMQKANAVFGPEAVSSWLYASITA